jgi:AraC family ethanolamine operon transcriptional activator
MSRPAAAASLSASHPIPTPAPRCRAESRLVGDVGELATLYRDWDGEFVQLGRGPFATRIGRFALPDVEVRWGHLNRDLLSRGVSRRPGYTIAPVVARTADWLRQGRRLRAGTVELVAPGAALDGTCRAGATGLNVGVEPHALEDAVRVLLRREPGDAIPRAVGLHVPPEAFAALHDDIDALMRRADADPEAAGRLDAHEVVRLRARLLGRVARLFEAAAPDEPGLGETSRREVVRDAEDYLEARLAEPVTTIDLCRHLNVSRRTLFYAFGEVRGVSPMAYFKARRLNRARADLKGADPRTARVRDVARRWGFGHLSQFASDYARQFGERPSRTLGRG